MGSGCGTVRDKFKTGAGPASNFLYVSYSGDSVAEVYSAKFWGDVIEIFDIFWATAKFQASFSRLNEQETRGKFGVSGEAVGKPSYHG